MNELGVLLAFGGLTGRDRRGRTRGPHPATGPLLVGAVGLGAAWFVSGRARRGVVVLALG